ncbi:MAG: Gfo/Idh/MocA family oxidoreductase [Xanthobacteraceae bacterium]|nr:Gfo/Idh/MocA family oxidoreductase [Xanthobacteraceae bacterium]
MSRVTNHYGIFFHRKLEAFTMISAAVIGLGRWGKNIVESIQGKSQRLRIVRGVSKEPDLVRDFAAAKGFELSTDFEQAVADSRVQAVFLATPHSLHVKQIAHVASLGKPVWSEKPLALTRSEALRAVITTQKAGVPFALGNNKRCFSSMRELKRVVDEDVLGEVLHIEGHSTNENSTRVNGGWRDDPRESPGGGMTGAGLHLIDAFVNLVGPLSTVDARLFCRKVPPDPRDAATALVQFRTGATGVLATVRAAPMYWRVMVFGTKGWAEARDETHLTVATLGTQPVTQVYPAVDSLGVLLEAFGETIETGKPFPVTTEQMLDVAGAFEAIIRSMAQGIPVSVAR